MTEEIVIPMEGLPADMPIDFTFKAVNVGADTIYIGAELVDPGAAWSNYDEMDMGALGAGQDDYYIFDSPTRTKPATGTTETINLRVNFYSDFVGGTIINQDVIPFNLTFIDFNDAGYTVLEDNDFEIDTEGWEVVNESGSSSFGRTTSKSRTGIASIYHRLNSSTYRGYIHKSYDIPATATKAYIRVWLQFTRSCSPEFIYEFITDAGEVVKKRVISNAIDYNPNGGSEIFDQWMVLAAELPVNGTYDVRLRFRCESDCYHYDHGDRRLYVYYDDIRVIYS